jgi:hypothetical protein
MASILVATPCYDGLVSGEYAVSMLRLQREFNREGIDFSPVDQPRFTPSRLSMRVFASFTFVGPESLGGDICGGCVRQV